MKRKNESLDADGELKKTKLELGESFTLQKLKIDELLTEIKLSTRKTDLIKDFVNKLEAEICNIKAGHTEHSVSDLTWMKSVKLPLNLEGHSATKGVFRFLPVKHVKAIGSIVLGTFNRRHGLVDVGVEMPKECFQDKDHLNERYIVKRALFLADIAAGLMHCDAVQKVTYTYHYGNLMKPVLLVKPAEQDLRHVTFVLHVCPEEQTFKLNRFHITKNNIRSQWYASCQDRSTGTAVNDVATPHYNTWILADVVMLKHHNYLKNVLIDSEAIKDGILLLKVWLRQRHLDQGFGCFSGFILSMFVAYLVMHRKLNSLMTCYQVFCKTLVEIAKQDWTQHGITMATDTSSPEASNRPSLSDFHATFDVVFVDITGYVNLCADMNDATYLLVKHEARLAVEYMETSSAFENLLITSVSFTNKYDQTFHLSPVETLKSETVRHLQLEHVVMDFCGNYIQACVPHMIRLLRKALGQRIRLVSFKPPASLTWDVTNVAPSVKSIGSLCFGLILDPQQTATTHDLGPFGGSSEAEEFRAFWKEKSELRRFPDGSIREAVVWPSDTLADRRMICPRIVKHILVSHAGLSKKNIRFVSNQLDALLRPVSYRKASKSGVSAKSELKNNAAIYGTGEEQQASIIASCDSLGKLLHAAVSASSDVPLAINSIIGVAPAFRYAEVFPALPVKSTCKLVQRKNRLIPRMNEANLCPNYTPVMTVICLLEGSGKWPNDLEAVQRVKAAYYLSLSQALNQVADNMLTTAFADHLDVYKDGYVFRIVIGCTHEIMLHKALSEGRMKLHEAVEFNALEYQLIKLPRLTSLLHGLQQQNNTYSCTVRLAKRWFAAHMMLGEYIDEEVVELLVASLYTAPAPYLAPGAVMTGFLRFLHLLSAHDWSTEPLIVNLNNELTLTDCAEIRTKFMKDRNTLPLMFISTPVDHMSEMYTKKKPTTPILQRIAILANESRMVLEQQIEQGLGKAEFKQIFRPSLSTFNVVIELNSHLAAHRHCAIDSHLSHDVVPYVEPKPPNKDVWPVTDYDPVHIFVSELRAAFDDIAIFFYDKFGGMCIGVIWRDAVNHPQPFKISHVKCRLPQTEADGKDVQLVLNHDAVLEDFRIMGHGLVKNVVVKSLVS